MTILLSTQISVSESSLVSVISKERGWVKSRLLPGGPSGSEGSSVRTLSHVLIQDTTVKFFKLQLSSFSGFNFQLSCFQVYFQTSHTAQRQFCPIWIAIQKAVCQT